MASFDDWVCDPRLTLAGVEAFVAGPEPAGTPYLGEYFVCSTSGTTGNPGIFVHDRDACRVYHAMSYPLDLAWLSGRQWFRILSHRVRWAVVVGTGGHFAGEGWIGFLSRRHWWRRDSWKSLLAATSTGRTGAGAQCVSAGHRDQLSQRPGCPGR